MTAGGATALSVAIVALLCFLAGLVARSVTAQRVVDALKISVLSKIPAYDYLKRESASALGVAETAALPMVFVPMEGGWQLGVQTDTLSNGLVFDLSSPAPRTRIPERFFLFGGHCRPSGLKLVGGGAQLPQAMRRGASALAANSADSAGTQSF